MDISIRKPPSQDVTPQDATRVAPASATFTAKRSAPPAPIATMGIRGQARGGVPLKLPLPFLLTGMVSAALLGVLLPFVVPEALVAPGFPHVLALVHITTLGWLTMTIIGASLQLAPVMLVSPLRGARLGGLLYPAFTIGVMLLVAGFWTSRTAWLIVGGVLIVLAVACYVGMMAATLLRATKRPLSARYLATAVCYLCVVVSLGLTAALNFQFNFLGDGADRLLMTHITVGIAGWLTCTLMGVSYTLVRMFALVHEHTDTLGRAIFVLLNVGVLGLAAGFSFGWQALQVVAGLCLISADWLFAFDYWRMLRLRKRRMLDTTQRFALSAVIYLVIVVPVGVVVGVLGVSREPTLLALGLAALVGWLGQSILGYLQKIVPFLMWQTRYGRLVGRQQVPLMRDLIYQPGARASFWLINLALPVAVVCAWCDWALALQIATGVLGLSLVVAAATICGAVLPHRPRTAAPDMGTGIGTTHAH